MPESTGSRNDGNPGQDPQERRRHQRYPFAAAVEALEFMSETRIQGRVSDLSRGGCFMDTITPFSASSLVKIRFKVQGRTFEVKAKVVSSLAGMGMGVKFIYSNPEQVGTVEKLVRDLKGGRRPGPDLPQPSAQRIAQSSSRGVESTVLTELVNDLMRQCVLSNEKSKAMLQKLNLTEKLESDQAPAQIREN